MITDLGAIRKTIELLNRYETMGGADDSAERMEPEDFLSDLFEKMKINDATMEAVSILFFQVLKYEKLFRMISKNFYRSRFKRFPEVPNNFSLLSVFLYYALMELNENTRDDVKSILTTLNMKKAVSLFAYLKKSNFLPDLFQWATQLWDIDYVRDLFDERIRKPMFKEIYEELHETMEEQKRFRQKKPTKPIELQVLKRKKRTPTVQESGENLSLLEPNVQIKPIPVPKTTYMKPTSLKKLEEHRARHREEAKEFYKKAQKNAFRVANFKKEQKPCEEMENASRNTLSARPRKSFVNKEPSIRPKKTAAVIFREGARLLKIEQDKIKRLDEILRGAFSSETLKTLERDIQKEKTEKHLEEIEKKHLQGLLTYEEALIAKQRYFKKTKEGADEVRKEKEMWMKQLEKWKIEEQTRIRESVSKGKAFDRAAREAVEHVKEEKHRIALETMEESRSLKEKLLAEREEELKKKVQIIKEIKALQSFEMANRKENWFKSSVSIGFLCGMSMEELKERLLLLRLEMKKEIARRRDEIKQKKECRQAIMEDYRELIRQHQEIRRERKMEKTEIKSKLYISSPSVEELRRKLIEKRRERLQHPIVCKS